MSGKKCSLRAVAKASGYSLATVSMALRRMGRVPQATREKIERAARALGYVRDPGMSRLMSRARRSERLSDQERFVFLSESAAVPEADAGAPWLGRLFRAARDAAHLLGYELEAEALPLDPRAQKALSRKLRDRGIRGLIVGPVTAWSPLTLDFDWDAFACVEMGTTLQSPRLHRVERGFYDDLLELYAHLRCLGYRRIGLALSPQRVEFMHHRPEAALLYFERDHPEMEPVEPAYRRYEWNGGGLCRWLREQTPDVAVVYESKATQWIAQAGIRVPCDLGIADLSSNGGSQSGLVPDIDLLARETLHLLARMVEGGEFGLPLRPRAHRFRNLFHPGETLRAKETGTKPRG